MSIASTFLGTMVEPSVKATYQDVLDAPSNMVAEIIDGHLHLMSRPTKRHSFACSILFSKIGIPFGAADDPGGWIIVDEPEVHLAEDVVVPDLAGWRMSRGDCDPDAPYDTVAPDWVCEVLSPSTRRNDLGPKRTIYADSGVGHLWFVDPAAQTLDAFALRDGDWVSVGSASDQDSVCLPPFEAVTFPLGDLWW